jgi:hypothetical protein
VTEPTDAAARFEALVGELQDMPGVAVGSPGRGFGSGSLQADGRIFAMVSHGRLVLKLPRTRVAELTASGIGASFDAGKGRPLPEWITVSDRPDVPWRVLAREALAFVLGR